MNREDRAKQFAPFDALKGLHEALRKKEKEIERLKKLEISDEKLDEIQKVLLKIKRGDIIQTKCYENGEYLSIMGKVSKKDYTYKYVEVDERKIFFDDIYQIEIKMQ